MNPTVKMTYDLIVSKLDDADLDREMSFAISCNDNSPESFQWIGMLYYEYAIRQRVDNELKNYKERNL
jgi:hypothetical protein